MQPTRWLILAGVAVAGLAWALLVYFGATGVVGYDSSYSLAWGQELAAGRLPLSAEPGAPTPHPLGIAIGLLLALLPTDPRAGLLFISAASFTLAVFCAGLLAKQAADQLALGFYPAARASDGRRERSGSTSHRPPAIGGRSAQWSWLALALALAALGASPRIWLLAKSGALDLTFVACSLAALIALVKQRARTSFALLCVASSERPEGWILLLAAVAYLKLGDGSSGPAHTIAKSETQNQPAARSQVRPGLPELSAWLVLPPIAWLATGALFGSPFAGLLVTQGNAQQFDDPVGLAAALRGLGPGLASGPGWPAAAAGAAALVLVVVRWRRQQRAGARRGTTGAPLILAGLVAVEVAAFAATGIAGATPVARYLLCAQFALVSLGSGLVASLAVRASQERRYELVALAAVVCAAVVTGSSINAAGFERAQRVLSTQARVHSALASLTNEIGSSLPSSCRSIRTPTLAQIANIVLDGDVHVSLRSVRVFNNAEAFDGSIVFPKNRISAIDAGYGPVPDLVASYRLPPGFEAAASNDYWVAFVSCDSAPGS